MANRTGPWNDEPRNTPEYLRGIVEDFRRAEKWAHDEARGDCHPNDRDRFEAEEGMWFVAAREIEKAAAEIERIFINAGKKDAA